jgi:dipeptidyl aminopeptidase/acylaminoacyl peptidase
MGEYEQFTFRGWNDETVYCYVVKPIDFSPSRKYPVAFLIHGGPQGSFGNTFHYRWNPQAYAGAGYAAVMVDFHGSVGYGQAFTNSIRGDWGGKPLEDLQKGLAAALERYPWMDNRRVGALGASFGGYMINWIAGNWPDRFRCLVNHDGNLDERMAYFDTDELWFPEWDLIPRDCQPLPPSSVSALRANCCTFLMKTTGCSSRTTPFSGTRQLSAGWTAG